MVEPKIQKGRPLTPSQNYWLNRALQISGESISNVENAAKQFITVLSMMHGLYGAILTFSGMRLVPQDSVLLTILFVSPLFLWFVALYLSLQVFRIATKRFNEDSPEECQKVIYEFATSKQNWLRWAYRTMTLSTLMALFAICYWLFTGDPNPTGSNP